MELHRELEEATTVILDASIMDTEFLERTMNTSPVSREEMITAGRVSVADAEGKAPFLPLAGKLEKMQLLYYFVIIWPTPPTHSS